MRDKEKQANPIVVDITSPTGHYQRYVDGKENVTLDPSFDASWNYPQPRRVHTIGKSNTSASYYTADELTDLHHVIGTLGPTFQKAVSDTISTTFQATNVFKFPVPGSLNRQVPWKRHLSNQLLPVFMEEHPDQFDANVVQAIYGDNLLNFFSDLTEYISDKSYARFYVTFANPGRRTLRPGYTLMIDQFGVFSFVERDCKNFINKVEQYPLVPPTLAEIDEIMSNNTSPGIFAPEEFGSQGKYYFHCAGENFVRKHLGLNLVLNMSLGQYNLWSADTQVPLINADGTYRSSAEQKADYEVRAGLQ